TYPGLKNDDTAPATPPAIACSATPASPVGNYPIILAGGADPNYTLALQNGALTVTAAPLTCAAEDKSRAYGTANPPLTIAYIGLKNDDIAPATPPAIACEATPASPVGNYPIVLAGGADPNYALTLQNGALTVTAAPLICTAEDKSRAYGDDNPPLTIAYAGLKNDDVAPATPPAIACAATPASPVGAYQITLAGGADPNYTLILQNGALTVTRRLLTVTANNASRLYGDPNPNLTMTYDGFVAGDDVGDLDTAPIATCSATPASPVGAYAIIPANGVDVNYDFAYGNGTLTVTPAPLVAAAENKARVYGDPNPTLTIAYTGLKNDDAAPATPPAIACSATPASPVGGYPIVLAGGNDPNYMMALQNGVLTVTAAPLVAAAEDKSRAYGDANPALTIAYTGLKNDDTAPATLPAIACAATPASPVGNYPIMLAGGADPNYTLTLQNGALTVTAAPLIVTAEDKTRIYGDANPPLTITYAGLKNNDVAPATPPAIACAATPASPAGAYPITLAGGADPNYALTLVNGTLTVVSGAAMQIWAKDNAGNSFTLDFGEAETATAAFNPQWDAIAQQPAGDTWWAYLLNMNTESEDQQKLSKDYRSQAETTRWRLVIADIQGPATITLTWNIAAADVGRSLILQEIRQEQPVGFPVNMKTNQSLEIHGNAVFEIAYAPRRETTLALKKGWNIVGNPLITEQATEDIFGRGNGSVTTAAIWYWDQGRYHLQAGDEPFSPEKGYLVYSENDGRSSTIAGVQADGVIKLTPGWNLVSPVADGVMPSGDASVGSAWRLQAQSYQAVRPGHAINSGQGYWVYLNPDWPAYLNWGE
ncbi:MAG TPA: MBG domain-containing protein, partial [Lentisphaeria bacterium]|nr:MBG domain-containing protein [Lentisphaeria bacterium]